MRTITDEYISELIHYNLVDELKDNIDDITEYINNNNSFYCHPLAEALEFNRDVIADMLFNANPMWIYKSNHKIGDNFNCLYIAIIKHNIYMLNKMLNWAAINNPSIINKPMTNVYYTGVLGYDNVSLLGFAIINSNGNHRTAEYLVNYGVDLTTKIPFGNTYQDYIDLCLDFGEHNILVSIYSKLKESKQESILDFENKVFKNYELRRFLMKRIDSSPQSSQTCLPLFKLIEANR